MVEFHDKDEWGLLHEKFHQTSLIREHFKIRGTESLTKKQNYCWSDFGIFQSRVKNIGISKSGFRQRICIFHLNL